MTRLPDDDLVRDEWEGDAYGDHPLDWRCWVAGAVAFAAFAIFAVLYHLL